MLRPKRYSPPRDGSYSLQSVAAGSGGYRHENGCRAMRQKRCHTRQARHHDNLNVQIHSRAFYFRWLISIGIACSTCSTERPNATFPSAIILAICSSFALMPGLAMVQLCYSQSPRWQSTMPRPHRYYTRRCSNPVVRISLSLPLPCRCE